MDEWMSDWMIEWMVQNTSANYYGTVNDVDECFMGWMRVKVVTPALLV